MIGQFTALLGKKGINIVNMANRSKGNCAYTVIDAEADPRGSPRNSPRLKTFTGVRIIK